VGGADDFEATRRRKLADKKPKILIFLILRGDPGPVRSLVEEAGGGGPH
jgi:hypothetical protein